MRNILLPFIIFFFIAAGCRAQAPVLWGMSPGGGVAQSGLIFDYQTGGGTVTDQYDLGNANFAGLFPKGSLLKASNGLLYGMASEGGADTRGLLFSFNIINGAYADLHDFGTYPDGYYPSGGLLQANDTMLYGMTPSGGANFAGMIFSYNISADTETDVYDFEDTTTDGQSPFGSLIMVNDSLLCGMTLSGGTNGEGVIFSFNIHSGVETVLHNFGSGTDGQLPYGSLVQASDSLLLGMTQEGGADSAGVIFSYNIFTGAETDVHDFGSGADGRNPGGSLIKAANGTLYGMTNLGGANSTGTIFSFNIVNDTETVLHSFGKDTDGTYPHGSLMQASNGLLYGMTEEGGSYLGGTIFSYNIAAQTETVLHSFNFIATDGYKPDAELIEDDDYTTLGVDGLQVAGLRFQVYPNPSSGSFTISTSVELNNAVVEIDNMLGEKVLSIKYQDTRLTGRQARQKTIDASNLPAGVYFVKVSNEQQQFNRKLIIQ